MVPLLRVLAAVPAAGGDGSCAAASAGLLLDFVAGSEARHDAYNPNPNPNPNLNPNPSPNPNPIPQPQPRP
jgi:hypothetical protein